VTETEEKVEFQQKEAPIKPSSVKVGDYMMVYHFVKVEEIEDKGASLLVRNIDTGLNFGVNGAGLVERLYSADSFVEEIKTSRTNIVKILKESYNIPFKVCFDKEPEKKTGIVRERVLRGRLIGPGEFGRSMVEDIDVPKEEYNVRLVDHRTIKWLIVKGIKYIVK
jgi:hypothetical protein